MDQKEQYALQRMMDITRATLYFAKAVILVEGITEALLIPVLARRLGYNLAKEHISVIPICGVAFKTFEKLLNPTVLSIPVAIVTDADPKVIRGETWETDKPEVNGTAFKLCDRTQDLIALFSEHTTVKVFHSKLTLEYDLAEAGDGNAAIMASAWESCFVGSPGTFNAQKIASGIDRNARALTTWRGICRAQHSGSKGEFAHRLATQLAEMNDAAKQPKVAFETPLYIKGAIEHVVNMLNVPVPATGALST